MGFADMMKKSKEDRESGVDQGGGDFKNFEVGTYTCALKDAEYGTSAAGDKQLWLEWQIIEGPLKGDTDRQYHSRLDASDQWQHVRIKIMEKELNILECNLDGLTDGDEDEIMEGVALELLERVPIVTLVVKRGKKRNPDTGEFYLNKNIKEYLGAFEGDLQDANFEPEKDSDFLLTSHEEDVPEEPKEVEVAVGSKFKYTGPDKKVYSGEIKKIDEAKGTLDFPLHKGITLKSLIEAV